MSAKNFKKGDKVTIMSKEEYLKYANKRGVLPGDFYFTEKMAAFCGKTAVVTRVAEGYASGYYLLDIDNEFYRWSDYMFKSPSEPKTIFEQIERVNQLFRHADSAAQEICAKAQEYVGWDDELYCEYLSGDELVIGCSKSYVVPAEKFFDWVLKKGSISESQFISLAI